MPVNPTKMFSKVLPTKLLENHHYREPMKECELCNKLPARMLCESDQANLCLACDAKVHSANFLVARHVRKLLCHVCQSPTEWQASGVRPCPTLSICNKCFSAKNLARKQQSDENENQVVPFTSPVQATDSAPLPSEGSSGDAMDNIGA